MNKSSTTVVFNATSLRPGSGLNVLLGVLQGLSKQEQVAIESIVVCSFKETAEAVKTQGLASRVVLRCKDASLWRRQWWVTMSMGKFVNSLKPDLFFSFNQFVGGVKVPQAVYHLNLTRFMPVDSNQGIVHRLVEWSRNRGAKLALQQADANVFESNYLHACASKVHTPQNGIAKVIYIGLPDDLINTASHLKSSDAGSASLIAITNHNEWKDNATLIRVLHSLVENYPFVNWRLKIAANINSEKWKPVKKLAEKLGVADKIEWLGFVDQKQLTQHLQESLCLVSTSRIESFCTVALESMARGCPAVVADASSMPESVGDAAVLVAAGDHHGFADAIATFQAEPEVRADFVQFGFERIEEFRGDRCGAEFANLMLQLTSKG